LTDCNAAIDILINRYHSVGHEVWTCSVSHSISSQLTYRHDCRR